MQSMGGGCWKLFSIWWLAMRSIRRLHTDLHGANELAYFSAKPYFIGLTTPSPFQPARLGIA